MCRKYCFRFRFAGSAGRVVLQGEIIRVLRGESMRHVAVAKER
jgi:hypothetical protein